MWKRLDAFLTGTQRMREILESVFDGADEKSKIDAGELNVVIPDLLLRECEREIHRRNVDNVYTAGKLDVLR